MNTYSQIQYHYTNGRVEKQFAISFQYPRINTVVNFLDRKYFNYYIQEMEKVKNGELSKLKIEISEEYDVMIDQIEIEKEWSYPNGMKGKGPEKIETSELLDFFKIMKNELGLSDEIVVDKRCELDY